MTEHSAPFVFQTWARTVTSRPRRLVEPGSTARVSALLREANEHGRRIKPFGTAHSPSDIACCTDTMMSLRRMNRILEIDSTARTVRVQGGATIAEINTALARAGFRLPQQTSIVEQ